MELKAIPDSAESAQRVVQTYREANTLLGQGHYGEALAKYGEVISEGSRIGDPMVLKLVSAALRLSAQCQFRLWRSRGSKGGYSANY